MDYLKSESPKHDSHPIDADSPIPDVFPDIKIPKLKSFNMKTLRNLKPTTGLLTRWLSSMRPDHDHPTVPTEPANQCRYVQQQFIQRTTIDSTEISTISSLVDKSRVSSYQSCSPPTHRTNIGLYDMKCNRSANRTLTRTISQSSNTPPRRPHPRLDIVHEKFMSCEVADEAIDDPAATYNNGEFYKIEFSQEGGLVETLTSHNNNNGRKPPVPKRKKKRPIHRSHGRDDLTKPIRKGGDSAEATSPLNDCRPHRITTVVIDKSPNQQRDWTTDINCNGILKTESFSKNNVNLLQCNNNNNHSKTLRHRRSESISSIASLDNDADLHFTKKQEPFLASGQQMQRQQRRTMLVQQNLIQEIEIEAGCQCQNALEVNSHSFVMQNQVFV